MERAQKEKRTILSPNLTQAEKLLLAQTVSTPGWKVVVKIANEACARFTEDTIRLDPETEDYERIVVERQRRARNASEFSDDLMKSVHAHADSIRKVDVAEQEEAEKSVGEMFGIHPAKKINPNDAIKNVFGIHPAKPKKKVQS